MPPLLKSDRQLFEKSVKRKWPTISQWRQLLKVSTRKEKIIFLIFFLLFITSSLYFCLGFYYKNTEIRPVQGGTHIEGILGQPRFINPIYANSDADRDLVELIFSGLMKYDENLQIVPDLAENYEIEENGQVYKFYLRENIVWQDKTPLTADDIIFTIKTIQDPDYKSPLRANWVGVEVEKINDLGVKFILRKSYNAFLENCAVKILPKHIWQNIPAENFAFDAYNLSPIGSGPYRIESTKQGRADSVKSLTLARNDLYFGQKPYISEIKFLFFENEKDLILAAQQGRIKGLSITSFRHTNKNWQEHYLSLPRYFALFFNPEQSEFLGEKEMRIALNYATDKQELVKNVLALPKNSPLIEKTVADSPILPKVYDFNQPEEIYQFDLEKAKTILDELGFEKQNQDGIREKEIEASSFRFKSDLKEKSQGQEVRELQKCLAKFPDIYPDGETTGYFGSKTKEAVNKFQEKYAEEILTPSGFSKGTGMVAQSTREKLNEVCFEEPNKVLTLKFDLVTVDQLQLVKVAEEIKKQWQKAGIDIEIRKFPISQLEQEFIKPRNYQILLFGEVLGAVPDPLPFWHSSQTRNPGLNLALYENEKADKLLEKIRQSLDPEEIKENLILLQDVIIKDAPAVFLYCPDFTYLVSNQVKGINIKKIVDPSKRFSGIEKWYIKTKRVWQ